MAPGDVLVLVVVTRAWVTVLDIVPATIVLLLRRRPSRRVVALGLHRRRPAGMRAIDDWFAAEAAVRLVVAAERHEELIGPSI